MSEKIYLVVPVYKVEAYLERCIDSILNQTYTNWELVLVDDGSPDCCPAICDEYAAKDSRIQVIHQKNGGVSAARNAGIRYVQKTACAETDWIVFIDSDDYVHPDYLQLLHTGAKELHVDICGCGHVRRNIQDNAMPALGEVSYQCLSPETYWCQDRTNAMVIWGKLYKVSCFDTVLYPVGVIHEDEFVTYRILFNTEKIAFTNAQIYVYCVTQNSIMQAPWTPARLAGLDAFENQIQYFRERGFPEACRHSARDLLQHSIKHMMYMKNLSPRYDYLLPEVRRRKRWAFRLYAREVGLKDAFSYWYEVRIKSPMKRVLGRESVWSFLKRRIKKKLHIR